MDVPELQYEPSVRARPVVIERDGDVMRVVVAMQGVYAPLPEWVMNSNVFALVLVPVWFVGVLVVRAVLRLPKPARAVFEVGDGRFTMRLRDPLSGKTTVMSFPRSAVVEARANRFERGLWLDVPGYVMNTYLTDVPRATIDRLETALRWVLGARARARRGGMIRNWAEFWRCYSGGGGG